MDNFYYRYKLRLINKYGPPGPPPRSHWKWHEPTHRWRNPANWEESHEHTEPPIPVKLDYGIVSIVQDSFSSLGDKIGEYNSSYGDTNTEFSRAMAQIDILSRKARDSFKIGEYKKVIDHLTRAEEISDNVSDDSNLRDDYNEDEHITYAGVHGHIHQINTLVKKDVFRKERENKLKTIGGENSEYLDYVKDGFKDIDASFGRAIKNIFQPASSPFAPSKPIQMEQYLSDVLHDIRTDLNTDQWGTRKGLHDAITTLDMVTEEGGKSRALTNVKNKMIELSNYMKEHEDKIMFDTIVPYSDERSAEGNLLEVGNDFDENWEPTIRVHRTSRKYHDVQSKKGASKVVQRVSDGYKKIAKNLQPPLQKKFQESLEKRPPKIIPKNLWGNYVGKYGGGTGVAEVDREILGFYSLKEGIHLPPDAGDHTIIHEIAHQMDHESLSPWATRKMDTLYSSRNSLPGFGSLFSPEDRRKFITDYATFSAREFFAETMATYLIKPLKLKRIDPEAYEIMAKHLFQ